MTPGADMAKELTLSDGRKVVVRRIGPDDSISMLTALLHRSYKRLADMGLRFTATYQDDDETLARISDATCYVGFLDDSLIATVCLYPKSTSVECEWYKRTGVHHFGQFAVEPALQRNGIGSMLLDIVEQTARDSGATDLALDTAEGAAHLITYYESRGYRFVEHVQWPVTNYRSVILSKSLVAESSSPST